MLINILQKNLKGFYNIFSLFGQMSKLSFWIQWSFSLIIPPIICSMGLKYNLNKKVIIAKS